MELKRFSDFATEPVGLEGDKWPIVKILNREIVITGYRLLKSKFDGKNKSGMVLQLQFKFNNSDDVAEHILFTGSDVLIDQMRKYGDHIPFLAVIVKINRHYTMK